MDPVSEENASAAMCASKAERTLVRQIAVAARVLSHYGHDDFNQGQVSARLPNAKKFFIKKALCGFDECAPDSMVIASVDHSAKPHRDAPPELPLHQAIYERWPEVNAIIHSHAPYTLMFGATDYDVLPVSHEGAALAGHVARFTKTTNTILSIDVARDVAETASSCERYRAILLRNHGGVMVGKTLRHAAVMMLVLERACKLQLELKSFSVPFHVSSVSDVKEKKAYIYSDESIKSYWEHCVRLISRTNSECKSW